MQQMEERKPQQEIMQDKANLVRILCLKATTEAGSGHPTSCLSAADLTTVLFDQFFTFDVHNPNNPLNDRFILSKGHTSPLLYTMFALSGGLPLDELMTLRKFTSRLQGHPATQFPYAEVMTGSLGQGLSIGAGNAFVAKKDGLPFKTYVLLGDGELAEGSNWEAANFASYYKLDNLIAIVDVNRLGQSQETMFGHHGDEYGNRFKSFGWEVIQIDGHNLEEIHQAFFKAVGNTNGKPVAIIAKTKKGKGVSFLEDHDNWHGKTLKKEELEKALEELGETDESLRFDLRKPIEDAVVSHATTATKQDSTSGSIYKKGEEIATREVYGKILVALGEKDDRIYALDAEVKNSTFSIDFKQKHPDRFIECFIAEQNMVGVALGLSTRGKIPFVSTFAAFLTRAFDQIRMSVLSHGNIKFVGSHAGVSIGEDGPSQMGLEDIALFGALPGSVILHPADAVSTAAVLPHMVTHKGIIYLRTLRPKTPVLYEEIEEFPIGGSKTLRSSEHDVVTIVAAGITVDEALKAYEVLKQEGIVVRVVDCYSIKPIDKKTLEQCSNETVNPILITVEDHFAHGGLGDFVLDALAEKKVIVHKLAVDHISRSGTKEELLKDAGIDASAIVQVVRIRAGS